MRAYYGSSPFHQRSFDIDLRVFQDNPNNVTSVLYPSALGNMTVGIVEQVGSEVKNFAVGDRVFGWLPVADWHVTTEEQLYLLNAAHSLQ